MIPVIPEEVVDKSSFIVIDTVRLNVNVPLDAGVLEHADSVMVRGTMTREEEKRLAVMWAYDMQNVVPATRALLVPEMGFEQGKGFVLRKMVAWPCLLGGMILRPSPEQDQVAMVDVRLTRLQIPDGDVRLDKLPRALDEQEVATMLWAQKNGFRMIGGKIDPKPVEEHQIYANLRETVVMHDWNGDHPCDENTVQRPAVAGTRVLITMISRMGDVGVRDVNLDNEMGKGTVHGYMARVGLNQLRDFSLTK